MNTGAAKYIQIFETLRNDILNGKYAASKRFPSETMLCRRFRASRATIERALRELKRAGLLESRVGWGFCLSLMARNAFGTIGLIVPDYQKIDFFTSVCTEISRDFRDRGYSVLLGDISAPDPQMRGKWTVELARSCVERKITGVILEPVDLVDGSASATKEALRILDAAGIPVVLIDRDIEQPPMRSRYDLVGIDNVQAGYRLARHLLDQGARRIRFLTEPRPASTIRQRIQGVAQAVIDDGGTWRKEHVIEIDPEDHRAIASVFAGKNPPDAIICRNDPLAARFIQMLAKQRKKVPRQVMIAGFDDAEFARYLSPALTSIRQPIRLIAEAATETLLNRIRNPKAPPKSIQLDVDLVCRASSRVCRT